MRSSFKLSQTETESRVILKVSRVETNSWGFKSFSNWVKILNYTRKRTLRARFTASRWPDPFFTPIPPPIQPGCSQIPEFGLRIRRAAHPLRLFDCTSQGLAQFTTFLCSSYLHSVFYCCQEPGSEALKKRIHPIIVKWLILRYWSSQLNNNDECMYTGAWLSAPGNFEGEHSGLA